MTKHLMILVTALGLAACAATAPTTQKSADDPSKSNFPVHGGY